MEKDKDHAPTSESTSDNDDLARQIIEIKQELEKERSIRRELTR